MQKPLELETEDSILQSVAVGACEVLSCQDSTVVNCWCSTERSEDESLALSSGIIQSLPKFPRPTCQIDSSSITRDQYKEIWNFEASLEA